MKYLASILITTAACLSCGLCQAGETYSSTFYYGEDNAVENARPDAIHFDHYAQIKHPGTAVKAGATLKTWLMGAVSPSALERPVFESGFRLQTESTKKGLQFSAAFRF